MRARSLKPGFFSNEELLDLPFEYRLLFAGLWCVADREGRLEDRPKRIKLHVFPGDDVNISDGLNALCTKRFIQRYEVEGVKYIQILSWRKHQNPHPNESPSTIPAPPKEEALTTNAQQHHSYSLTPSSLTPDSGSLTPDTHVSRATTSTNGCQPTEHAHAPADLTETLDAIKLAYPDFAGRADWTTALHHVAIRVEECGAQALLDGVKRYAAYCEGGGVSSTKFVMSPGKFFSDPNQPWLQAWELPKPKANGNGHANPEAATAYEALLASDGAAGRGDPKIEHALDAIGGWSRIRMRTNFDEKQIRREFCEAYSHAS
jgi:hypothetical protein